MEVFDLLTALPASLTAVVLSQYLQVHHVVKLDSALCNRPGRARLLEVLQSSAVILSPPFRDLNDENLLEWLHTRKVKVSALRVSYELPAATLLPYLEMTAPFLTEIKLVCLEDNSKGESTGVSRVCEIILPHCSQITSFTMNDTCVPRNFRSLLAGMVNLRHLAMIDPRINITSGLFSEFYGTRIQSFQLVGQFARELQNNLHTVFETMSTLRTLTLGGGLVTSACIRQIAQCVPSLTSLTLLGEVCADVSVMVEWAALCPKIVHLDCQLTDAALLQIVQILPLVSLRVNNSAALTHQSLTAIATYLPNSLETLCIANNPLLNQKHIINVLQKCTKLRALEFGHDDCPCHELYDKVFISRLSNLESISMVSDAYSMNSKAVALVAKLCTALKHLRINTPAKLNSELHKLVENCVTLRVLQLNEWNMSHAEEWRVSRPLCAFEDVESDSDIAGFGANH